MYRAYDIFRHKFLKMPTSSWDIIKKAVIPMIASVVVNGVEKKRDRTSTNPEGLSGSMNILSGGKKEEEDEGIKGDVKR